MDLIEKIPIIRYADGQFTRQEDVMVNEYAIELLVNGRQETLFRCSPAELQELVVGYLYTQALISSPADICRLDLDEEQGLADVVLKLKATRQNHPVIVDRPVFCATALLANQQRFFDDSILQKATAGVHRCALCDDTGTYFACEDISRHCALDKLVGKALMNGVILEDKYIITSGRVPLDMMLKAINIGVPMFVSRSTPTVAAVRAAQEAGLTLLGFSRENRFNIYCGAELLSE